MLLCICYHTPKRSQLKAAAIVRLIKLSAHTTCASCPFLRKEAKNYQETGISIPAVCQQAMISFEIALLFFSQLMNKIHRLPERRRLKIRSQINYG